MFPTPEELAGAGFVDPGLSGTTPVWWLGEDSGKSILLRQLGDDHQGEIPAPQTPVSPKDVLTQVLPTSALWGGAQQRRRAGLESSLGFPLGLWEGGCGVRLAQLTHSAKPTQGAEGGGGQLVWDGHSQGQASEMGCGGEGAERVPLPQ